MVALAELFASDGALSACLENFAPRPEQLAMAEAVERAINECHNLVIEAGTGTGKTLAYLLPVLRSGRRAIVSTRTRALQDQLYHRDLPMIGAALGRPAKVQLLKGRRNYLCLQRLDSAAQDPGLMQGPWRDDLAQVRRWAGRTRSGDTAEVSDVPEDSPVWPRVTSTAENCLGSRCGRFDDCHVAAARQQARDADIVVVNHHLLMADLTMKDEGFGELLPGVDAVVVDEAHHFPEIAQDFFNTSLSSRQVEDLLGDMGREALESGVRDSELSQALHQVTESLKDCREALGSRDATWRWEDSQDFESAFDALGESLESLRGWFDTIDQSGAGLARCRERLQRLVEAIRSIGAADDDAEALRWLRRSGRGFTANRTPLEIADELGNLLESLDCSWILTSATLSVQGDFGHFVSRLGLADPVTREIPSPFDYAQNARLCLPELPMPDAADYTACLVDTLLPLLRAAGGRAFMLFTSYRALNEAAARLAACAGDEFSILVQGTAPRTRLIEQFARVERPVLLGTATFWEGIDIRGPGLVIVAIDRLPFASPGDPLLAARLESIRQHGGNPFMSFQLPQAVLTLKQGAGRLIRDYDDYGIVVIGDPRISRKRYGRVFLDSLPSMPVVTDVAEAIDFLCSREAGGT